MKSKILVVAALVAFVAAGCSSSQTASNDTNGQNQNPQQQQPAPQPTPPTPTPPDTTNKVDSMNQPQVVGINITSSGFTPSKVTIHKGDYVQFTNQDSNGHWPASNPHPSHTGYPGFDALHSLGQGEKYRFQFNRTGTFGFHDHINPSTGGSITVLP